MKTIDKTTITNSVILITDNLLKDVAKSIVYLDGTILPDTGVFYTVTNALVYDATATPGRAAIEVYNLSSQTCYHITATILTNPGVEFWKYDTEFSALDTSLVGGSWTNGVVTDALGFAPQDIIIDGDQFMSPSVSYAPEEFVPGHTVDSLGINVYTKDPETYAMVITGSFPVQAGTTTTAQITLLPEAAAGFTLYFNGRTFDRSTSSNISSLSGNQFFVQEKSIILPPQPDSGYAGYTMVQIGGSGLVDSNMATIESTTTISLFVESLIAYTDVKSAYVLVNGREITSITTTTDYGYILTTDFNDNFRATVKVYNLPPGKNTVEAWFFNTSNVRFNRMNEEYFTVSSTPQSNFTLNYPPGSWEPYSDKAIVETGFSGTRQRQVPVMPQNFTKTNNRLNYPITTTAGSYSVNDILVYVNGVRIRPGFDFSFNAASSPTAINLVSNLYPDGVYISIVCLADTYDYVISGNILSFTSPLSNTTVKVTTFNNHDKLFMETERFVYSRLKLFVLSKPIVDDNYLWVYLDGIPLVHRKDFEIMQDLRTIRLSESLYVEGFPEILVTRLNQPDLMGKIVGYRVFQDFFERSHYKRLSKYHTTILTENLKFYDNVIKVNDENRLSPINPARNVPGVVLIDRERIEFFSREGDEANVLSSLRRGTLGTGPAWYVDEGTKVIDQGILQTIPYNDEVKVQTTLTTTATTYTISTLSNSIIGQGIVLSTLTNATDQIEVYYGGRQLKKSSYKGYETVTSTVLLTYAPEFTVTIDTITSISTITLNINGGIESGVQLSFYQKTGYVWTMTESLLTSQVVQAKFLRAKDAELPDTYYYGGDPRLLDGNYEPLTDDNDVTLRRY